MPNRRDPDSEWGNGAIVAIIAAMVTVMVVTAFTLHRNSPLVASGPTVDRIGTEHERPRRHCAREGTQRDRAIRRKSVFKSTPSPLRAP
jgi:hypothetical protein